MNKKEVQGTAREIKGKAEKGVGKVTGNERTQAHGAAEEARGNAEKTVGRVQSKAGQAKEDAKTFVERNTP